MIAYGMSPVVIRWDDFHHRPTWHIRHPLETFPSVDIQPGQTQQGLHFRVPHRRWLRQHGYSAHVTKLLGFENSLTEDSPLLL